VKVQNRMLYSTLLTLSRNYSYSQYLAQDEIAEYSLFAGTYTLNYTNNELGTDVSVNLTVAAPMLYTLNTSYRSIYFSCFSNDLLGMPLESVRLFLDGTRKEWGPVEILGNSTTIQVCDYFGDTVYAATVDLSLYTEFNVFLNMATLMIGNNFNETLTIEIRKSGTLLLKQAIGEQDALLFRFTTGTYFIRALYQNGTQVGDEKTVTLTANSTELVSFGWYSATITPQVDASGWWLFGILAAVYCSIIAGLYVRARGAVSRKTAIPKTRTSAGNGGLFSKAGNYSGKRR
jgi:hypothetical protein